MAYGFRSVCIHVYMCPGTFTDCCTAWPMCEIPLILCSTVLLRSTPHYNSNRLASSFSIPSLTVHKGAAAEDCVVDGNTRLNTVDINRLSELLNAADAQLQKFPSILHVFACTAR